MEKWQRLTGSPQTLCALRPPPLVWMVASPLGAQLSSWGLCHHKFPLWTSWSPAPKSSSFVWAEHILQELPEKGLRAFLRFCLCEIGLSRPWYLIEDLAVCRILGEKSSSYRILKVASIIP